MPNRNFESSDKAFPNEQNVQREKSAVVDETFRMVTHELKNIIQIAKLSDELIRKGIRDQNEKFLSHGLEGMAKALRDLEGFTWDLLTLTENFAIELRKVNLKTLLEELKNDLEDKTRDLGIKFEVEVEDSLPEVEADSRSLYRALRNIIQNAIEACDKNNSYIRIGIRSEGRDFCQVMVEDNGRGMTQEVKAKIFQPFFSTKLRRKNGLGLMIVDRICKAHKGQIKVESETGKGTRFTLTFPKVIRRAGN